MRVAAVGDVHVGTDSQDMVAEGFATVHEHADVLLLAGDLTRCGEPAEVKLLAEILAPLPLPIVAVLGNHDYHADLVDEVVATLRNADVEVLEGTTTVVTVGTATLGIAGTKGFGGGFTGASAAEFGEPVMKDFARSTDHFAARLERGLRQVADADQRIALLHYAPVRDTLRGEHPEVYPFLGSYLLGEAVDRAGADLVLHGHAHRGTERGMTPGGVRVRNVAQPVIRAAYRVFDLGSETDDVAPEPADGPGEEP
jgi:Icc-related predicted phosphoesterase